MKKIITTIICVLLAIFVLLFVGYNVFRIGLVFREIHVALEYSFYGISAILFYFLIFSPMITILFMKPFNLGKYLESDEHVSGALVAKAKHLLKYGNLDNENKKELKEALSNKDTLKARLYIIYTNKISSNIDKLVESSARDLLYLTAVSQSGFIDSMTVLSNSFRMMKKIVVMCGFRPTFIRTMKLFINVFLGSLAADGLQQLEVTKLFGLSVTGPLKYLTNSVANGFTNAFLLLRLGMLTKEYIYAKDLKRDYFKIRNNATVQAAKMIPGLMASVITGPFKGLVSFFKKNTEEKETPVEFSKEEEEQFETMIDWNWKKSKQ